MTSQTRMRMNHEVQSETPQRSALSRRLNASAMHSANAIHTEGPSFEFASSEPLFAGNVRPQPLHARLWAPSASRPFLTNAGHPHRG